MTDIALAWNPSTQTADWQIINGDISVGQDLQSAVIISLFTDARAPQSYAGTNLRGSWIDSYSPTPWGSRLWTLARAAISDRQALLNAAQDYCNEALAWMITDGVAASVSAAASWISSSMINLQIVITMPMVAQPFVFNFSWAWAQIAPGN
jgi:phage gp46-like protein